MDSFDIFQIEHLDILRKLLETVKADPPEHVADLMIERITARIVELSGEPLIHTLCLCNDLGQTFADKAVDFVQGCIASIPSMRQATNVHIIPTEYHFRLRFQTPALIDDGMQMLLREGTGCFVAFFNEIGEAKILEAQDQCLDEIFKEDAYSTGGN